MPEDPELQNPLSLTLNENHGIQNSPCHVSTASASPDNSCETEEIQVIVKEEEEGWTLSENGENSSSEAKQEDNAAHIYNPLFKVHGKDISHSCGVKKHQRLCLEKCSHESAAHCGQSSSSREQQQQRHLLLDSGNKPILACVQGKRRGNVSVHQCHNRGDKHFSCAGDEMNPICKSNANVCEGTQAEEESYTQGQNLEGKQLTSAEAKQHQAERSASYHTAPAALEDQTLHLTVRLQAGEGEKDAEEDEEIGGLINSDGEVVEWDSSVSLDRDSESTEDPHPSTGLSESQLQGRNQRDSSSPSLIMEVVSEGDDEESDEGEEKGRVAKMTAVSPMYCGKGPSKKTTDTKISVESELDAPERESDVPAKYGKRRGRRKISDVSLLSSEDMEAEPGISSRTRRQRVVTTTVETGELMSQTVRHAADKRPHRKKKDPRCSLEGKKHPGRKQLQVPIEIPAELLKMPKEKIDYHCTVCGKEFPHAYKLERHELIHTGEKPYCCSICGRGFNQKGNLKTHYKVHFGRKGSVDFDNEVNPLASELSEYLKSLPGESRIRSSLRCLDCGKDCESQSALQAHHITAHTQTVADESAKHQLLLCRHCGIQFPKKEKLEDHMKTHVKEKPYSCPDCGKRFINESYIQIHQRLHTGEKPFLCSQCGRGFHTASSLKLHEMQHSGEKPFSCYICGKNFRINSYLTAHYQTHINDRPFTCNVCGKGYARAEELKVHHRLHTGERPYECSECGKSFIYRQGLRQHQRTHAGRRIGPTRQLGRPKQQDGLDT